MKTGAIAAIAAAGALALLLSDRADAQPRPAAEETAEGEESPPIAARRSVPPGVAARKERLAPDWRAVREAAAATEEEDAAFERRIRAMNLTRAVSETERESMRPRGIRRAPAEAFAGAFLGEQRRTRVPLLAPGRARAAAADAAVSDLRIIARENAYTALGELPGGARFELMGTCMRVVLGESETARRRLAERGSRAERLDALDAAIVVSRHEQGLDASFSKFNCAYMLTIACADPETDARCADDSVAREILSDLAILNIEEGDAP